MTHQSSSIIIERAPSPAGSSAPASQLLPRLGSRKQTDPAQNEIFKEKQQSTPPARHARNSTVHKSDEKVNKKFYMCDAKYFSIINFEIFFS